MGRDFYAVFSEWPARSQALATLVCFVALCFAPWARADVTAPSSQLARIQDLATVKDIRVNQLVGYGIVVGLHGTGDSPQVVATLRRMRVTGTGTPQLRNMAAVFIVATLPPFAKAGNKIDVIVSSAGDARSIEGGLLLMTPLYGPDGHMDAQAQGAVVLGGSSARSESDPATGRIPSGAVVERAVPLHLHHRRKLTLVLNSPDLRTAGRMSSSINKTLGRDAAHARDSRRVEITVLPGGDIPDLLARVESIQVQVFPRPRVVVNERIGTVVTGGEVRLQPVSILHDGLGGECR